MPVPLLKLAFDRMSYLLFSVVIVVSDWNWKKLFVVPARTALLICFCARRMSLRIVDDVAHAVDTANVCTLVLARNSVMNAESQSRRIVLFTCVIWTLT